MKVTQIADILNSTIKEVLGEEAVTTEDLSNIVDLGKEVVNTDNVDNYVKKLVDRIGKTVFVNKLYTGGVPSVMMDKWEFGSVVEKISTELPNAQESDSWKLENGKEYSQDVFYQPTVDVKFFNSKTTFEIAMSFTEKQVKESFTSVTELNGFYSMLQTAIKNSMTVKLDTLIMRTINNMIGETIVADFGAEPDYSKTGVKAVNLANLYKQQTGKTVTLNNAFSDSDFIRFSSYIISLYKDRLSKISKLFNVGGKERFTSATDLHLIILSDFAKASDVYLSSNVYHNEQVSLPIYESVPYWQGTGVNYELGQTSNINIKTSAGNTINATGIVGVMFDTQALGVSNLDSRVTSNYNAKAEFYNNYYKLDAGYYNDLNENFVVFFVGGATAETPSK